jgi:hypothetical protein
VFYNNVMLSGTVPQISLICGPCAGGAAYSPALTDFVIQTEQARMFITGPQVIRQVTGEEVSAEELGGAQSQMHYSGVVHLIARNDEEAIQICKRLLSFMPSNNVEDPPRAAFNAKLKTDGDMNGIVPADAKIAYDVRGVIVRIVDGEDFLEIQPDFAANIVIGFGRLQGRPVGIVAVCAFLQCIQHSATDVCGCAGIFTGSGAGAGRDYPPRGEAAVCVLGGDGAEAHGGAAQGVWRRVHRDVFEGTGRGPRGGVADGGDCGDGRGGRGGDCVPAGD